MNSIEEKDKDVKISEVEDQKHNKNEGVGVCRILTHPFSINTYTSPDKLRSRK